MRVGYTVSRAIALALVLGLTRCALSVDTSELSGGGPLDGAPGASAEAGDAGSRPEDASLRDVEAAADASPAATYAAIVAADHPAMYLRLDETSGVAAGDETGNYPGTAIGPVQRGVPGAFPGSLGVRFSGAQAGITVGSIFAFEGRKPYTLEAWVRPAAFDASYRYILGRDDSDDAGRQEYALYTFSNGVNYERYVAGSAIGISAPPTSTTEYHHVVLTYDGSLATLYVDGQVAGTNVDSRQAAAKTSQFFIGCGNRVDAFDFAGDIDDVAVYDGALSQAAVRAHFHAVRP